jgi:hypothetical protein
MLTNDQILEQWQSLDNTVVLNDFGNELIIAFVPLIGAATREECVEIARDYMQYHLNFNRADECAAAIRGMK